METFAGQACGAGAYSRVGEVLQQALATTLLCSCGILGLWAWMQPLLLALGQDVNIAVAASRCLLALAPALICEATDQCCRLYLAAQSVVQPAVITTLTATLLTPVYLHICCKWLHLGLFGVALAWNAVQATSLALMAIYCVLHTKAQPPNTCTWPGWTTAAFTGWGQYLRVAVPSCLMLCSEAWSLEVMVLLSGLLPNPAVSLSVMSITANLHDVCYMSSTGLGAATGMYIAQSLGAGRPRTARFIQLVGLVLGTLFIWTCTCLLLLGRNHFAGLFSSDKQVLLLCAQTIPAMALSLSSEGANTVLSGTIRACGKQKVGAVVGLTYWLVGLPLALCLAFKLHLGGVGLWIGMLGVPTALQMLLNANIVYRLDWEVEAGKAQEGVMRVDVIDKQSPDWNLPVLPLCSPRGLHSNAWAQALVAMQMESTDGVGDVVMGGITELAVRPSMDRPLLGAV